MNSSTILLVNAFAYTLTTIFYIVKKKGVSPGIIIYCFFSYAAWNSYLFYNHPMFLYSEHNSTMSITPFVYLYVVIWLFLKPFINIQIQGNSLNNTINRIDENLKKFCCCIFFLDILLLIPNLISMSGEWSDIRNAIYETTTWFWFQDNTILSHLHLLAEGLFPIVLPISLFFLLHNSNTISKIDVFLFSLVICDRIIASLLIAGRGPMLLTILYVFVSFIFLKDTIDDKIKRKFYFYLSLCIVPFVFFYVAVSFSRFSDAIEFYNYKYAGECFVNFNGIMYDHLKGTTNGNAYFTLFTRIFNPNEVNFHNTIEKWEFIKKSTNVSGQYFYTFVGALCFEFGKAKTFIMAIVFYIFTMKITSKKEISIPALMWIIVLMWMYVNGVFTLILQGSAGNLTILLSILIAYIYKNKHNYKFLK